MRQSLHCPDSERLSQLMAGVISDVDAADVERHVAECRQCAETIGSFHADDDPILLALRSPPPNDDAVAIRELVLQLQQLPNATWHQAVDRTRDDSSLDNRLLTQSGDDIPARTIGMTVNDEPYMLGSFRLMRIIGEGGMGVVYEAEDMMLDRLVAVKVIRPALAGDAATRQRFLREARASAMDDEHIVGAYQAGEVDRTLFLAMPLLKGETLESCLARKSKLPLEDVIRIGSEIAKGLNAAHRHGLIHRDLKPSNVWLESPGDRVKLLDFGLARLADGHEQLTHSSLIAGTPLYMAPEQARGDSIDHRADLFSLGCVLFRMATGKLAFSGNNVLSVLRALEMTDPLRIDDLDPLQPASLADLVERLLAKQPALRPNSTDEVLNALAEVTSECAGGAKRNPLWAEPRSSRRGILFRVFAGAALLSLVVGASFVLPDLRADKSKRTTKPATISTISSDLVLTSPGRTSTTGPAAAAAVAVDWELFYENTFDKAEPIESDERHSFGVRDGIKFEQINEQHYGTGFVNRYPLPGRDFATELRVRVRHARFSVRFRDVLQDPARSHVELLLEPDGSWHLNHGMHAAENSNSPSREITHLLHKERPALPVLQNDEWTTLRIEAVGEVITLYAQGNLIKQVTDSFTVSSNELPAIPELVVGFWSVSHEGGSTMETDYVRIWRPLVRDDDTYNREVAEWVLGIDGSIWGLQLDGASYVPLKTVDDLPLRGFRVASIELPYIETLTDDDLARLAGLTELRFLSVSHTNIGDGGIVHLANLPKLESLNLLKTQVTSAGLVHMEHIPSLRALNLGYNAAIDDAAVEHLAAMSRLTELSLSGTKLTPQGLATVKSALPNCAVGP